MERHWVPRRRLQALWLLWGMIAGLWVCGCSPEQGSPTGLPPMDRPSDLGSIEKALVHTQSELQTVVEELSAKGREPDRIDSDLQRIARHLHDLRWFYLPMAQARESIVHASDESLAHRSSRRDECLHDAREHLLQVSAHADPAVEITVEGLLEKVTDVESRARAGDDIRSDLESLAAELHLAVLKADLILDEDG